MMKIYMSNGEKHKIKDVFKSFTFEYRIIRFSKNF